MAADWDGLLDDVTETIGLLEPRGYLIMSAAVGLDPDPYAQVACEALGEYYLEVVSQHHLPDSTWPIDELALVAAGWEPPMGCTTNWSRMASSADEAAGLLIGALRFGRSCEDPDRYVGTVDRWPPPDDDDDPLPVLPRPPFDLAA
jgi:hypothetical protein